jgi:hypothetical protein
MDSPSTSTVIGAARIPDLGSPQIRLGRISRECRKYHITHNRREISAFLGFCSGPSNEDFSQRAVIGECLCPAREQVARHVVEIRVECIY